MWNLQKWYRLTHLKSRNRDTCREQSPGYQGGGRGMNWEMGIDIYTLSLKQITNENLL